MFAGALNSHMGGKLLKLYFSKWIVICGDEHIVSLLFKDFSKTTIVHEIIAAHKAIYNIFAPGIYHKPYSIFKYKSE